LGIGPIGFIGSGSFIKVMFSIKEALNPVFHKYPHLTSSAHEPQSTKQYQRSCSLIVNKQTIPKENF
jgi:hypothetical protein